MPPKKGDSPPPTFKIACVTISISASLQPEPKVIKPFSKPGVGTSVDVAHDVGIGVTEGAGVLLGITAGSVPGPPGVAVPGGTAGVLLLGAEVGCGVRLGGGTGAPPHA